MSVTGGGPYLTASVQSAGNVAQVTLQLLVPSGASVSPGPWQGTVSVTGVTGVQQITVRATFYGTIIGSVSVEPAIAAPGGPVHLQVLNTLGKAIDDPGVYVTVQGVPGASRWEQYATPGTRTLSVIASTGSLFETASAQVVITGSPTLFTLAPPSTTELPIIRASIIPGRPYLGTFSLGTPRSRAGVPVTATVAEMQAPPGRAGGPTTTAPSPGRASAVRPVPSEIITGTVLAPGPVVPRTPTTSYVWDFGDGTAPQTTTDPTVTHDFLHAIDPAAVEHYFEVACTASHDNVTVRRTIVLHSTYGICRRLGTVVPPITGAPTYAPVATIPGVLGMQVPLNALNASMVVHNLEAQAMTLDAMAVVPLSDAPGVIPAAPQFRKMSNPQTIAARSASALGSLVAFSEVHLDGTPANAFWLYYSGAMADGTPVRFSVVFRISATDSGLAASRWQAPPPIWNLTAAAQAVNHLRIGPGPVEGAASTPDDATRTISVPIATDAHSPATLDLAGAAIAAGLSTITAASLPSAATNQPQPTISARAIRPRMLGPGISGVVPTLNLGTTPMVRNLRIDPTNAPPVAEGAVCFPDDISDADAAAAAAQQLVCQLSSGPSQTVTIPAAFQNAQAGDVILSPAPTGDGDLIAAMFSALTPPQHHGHSGIMTANFYEITHCTASVDRVAANLDTDIAGIPTQIKPDFLDYGWPGSITQTVDEATTPVPWTAPEGKTYTETSFNFDDRGNPQQLVHPVVVKPLPENEAMARSLLRAAADIARSKGARYASSFNQPAGTSPGQQLALGKCYYSFYNYTKAAISAGFTDPAPAEAGWAQGLVPAVCSAFVWMSMKQAGIPCVSTHPNESLSDFTAAARATGEAVVSPDPSDPTPDGLVFYSEDVRRAGGQALYNLFMQQALDKELGLGTLPGVSDAIVGPIADQLLNCFAFGDPTMVGSDNWQNPGVGNAISPDNIMLWSPPYFGFAEPLQYLPAHTDQYTPSHWVRVTTHGTISGRVTRSDTGAPVPGAMVWANLNVAGMFAQTGPDGSYTLSSVPLGSYSLKASATITVNSASVEFSNDQGLAFTLTADNNANAHQDLEISPASSLFRRIDVAYQVDCTHGDCNPANTHGSRPSGPFHRALYVTPGQQTDTIAYTYDYSGGGYFHITYTFTAALLQDGSTVMIDLAGVMYDDGSGDEQTSKSLAAPLQLAAGASVTSSLDIEHDGFCYSNGPSHFTFTLTNNQQTG